MAAIPQTASKTGVPRSRPGPRDSKLSQELAPGTISPSLSAMTATIALRRVLQRSWILDPVPTPTDTGHRLLFLVSV